MNRREIMTLLGGAAAWPVAARAQVMPVIGFLNSSSQGLQVDRLRDFQQGLRETGYVEGGNVAIEYRWADGQYDRLPGLAADLVSRQVAVIFAGGPAAYVAKAATTAIPIVFVSGEDPVDFGLVASFNRPVGNITGVSTFNAVLGSKRLELLHELVPNAAVLALLVNPNNPRSVPETRETQAAVRAVGRNLIILNASTESEIDAAFATLV